MKTTIKILTLVSTVVFSALYTNAYTEIECTTDSIFAANSCNQCFDGGQKGEGDNLGFLEDEWVNDSTIDKILYKEEQDMPIMKNLLPSLVTWKEDPSKTDFWEYTKEFNSLFNTEEEGYVLAKGKKVIWLKSKKGYAYSLAKNKAEIGKNIGLLIYPISVRNYESNGEIGADATEHKECVLFKSGDKKEVTKVTPKDPENPTNPVEPLPTTGPENYILIMLFAMILGFGIMKIRKKA